MLTRHPTRSYYLWSIGCQMNRAESERLSNYLAGLGYRAAPAADEADLIVLNSCVVRRTAEERTINKMRSLKALKKGEPWRQVVVTGCIVPPQPEELRASFPFIDLFFPAGDFEQFTRWTRDQGLTASADAMLVGLSPAVSVLVPIMQGCDNFCTYCIVPYRRGRERSRQPEEIVCEVNRLVERGSREVTLVGQNVNSYGRGLPQKTDLADLLQKLSRIDGLKRIRFLTNHPKDMSPRLVETMTVLPKVCESINLPVQAGDDEILKAMRRGYTIARYRSLVDELRHRLPGLGLSTDLIVGFPGETEEQFGHSLRLLDELKFDMVHVAAYSPRPGTVAARSMKDNVPGEEKKRRLHKVEYLQEKIAAEINGRLVGREVEVLVERKKKGKWQGRTRTDKLVFFPGDGDLVGYLVNVKVDKASAWSMQGQKVN